MDLLENALDFFLEALNKLEGDDPPHTRDLKYSILHACSAVELLMKQRLFDEHWSLVFHNIDEASRARLETGDFRSVEFRTAIERLKNLCAIELDEFEDSLDELRRLRNKIEHFHITLNNEQAQSLIVSTWTFAFNFIHDDIAPSHATAQSEAFELIREKIVQHQLFIAERLQQIESQLSEWRKNDCLILDCPLCQQDSVLVDGGEVHCEFCRKVYDWEEFADAWLTSQAGYKWTDPKERFSDPPLHTCPFCGLEGLYHFDEGDANPPSPAWICLHCGSHWEWNELTSCIRCDTIFVTRHADDPFCGECWPDD